MTPAAAPARTGTPDGRTAPALLRDLAQLQAEAGGILRRHHLEGYGLSAREIAGLVRQDAAVRVHRDAYRVPAADEPPQETFRAAVRSVRRRDPDRVVTGSAAVATLGLAVFGRPQHVHVARSASGGSSARSLVRTVAAPPPDQLVRLSDGVVAGPARAALDTARLDGVVAGVVAADDALRRRLATSTELALVAATMGGLRGVVRSRLCVELASADSESPGESWSAVVLHRHGILAPQRQALVRDELGVIGRVDFLWPDAGVVGEFDGRVKYGRLRPDGRPVEDVLWDEKLREDRLRAAGLVVVRWTTADLRDPTRWLVRLRAALAGPPARPRTTARIGPS